MNKNHSLEFKVISKHRMVSHYLPKLLICLKHLEHNQIWNKESNDLNSIGGIVLHVIEHLKRNTARIKDERIVFNKGIENHFPDSTQDKTLLIEELEKAFKEYESALNNLNEEFIDIYNIYHLVEHTGYHLGQIIDRTQRITGKRFQFVQNGINERELKGIVEEEMNI